MLRKPQKKNMNTRVYFNMGKGIWAQVPVQFTKAMKYNGTPYYDHLGQVNLDENNPLITLTKS